MSAGNFLSRWSRRKTEAKHAGDEAPPSGPKAASGAPPVPAAAAATQAEALPPPEPLPPLESLTPESDFSPFMRPDVDAGTRRLAMKRLFEDPRYNVMDRLDVYIDDYSLADPLPEGWLEKMTQVARLGIFQPPPEPAEGAQPPPQGPVNLPRPTSLPAAETAPGGQLPPVTSGEGIDASPVRQSPPAEA